MHVAQRPKPAEHSLKSRLDEYLSESVEDARKRERSAFDELAGPYESRLVLFGAGGLGRRTLNGLRRAGIEPLAFCDNNPTLWGQHVDGLDVYSPQNAAEKFGCKCAFVVTIWTGHGRDRMAQRIQQLKAFGCETVIRPGFLYWKYPEIFLPYYPLDLPHKLLMKSEEAREVYDYWEDDSSRREYVAQIGFRLHLDYESLGAPVENRQYFPPKLFRLTSQECLIDCGAFDGDTILEFIGRHDGFDRVVAFEPDPLNWTKLQETLSALPAESRARITAFPHAVGANTCQVRFDSTGTDLSTMGTGSVLVDCVELDKVLATETPTLVKFDIEGAELEALAGGRETIRRHEPILAVSAYHQQSHLWEVPKTIRNISEDYRYLLRPQGNEGWDLVCYAAPAGRLQNYAENMKV